MWLVETHVLNLALRSRDRQIAEFKASLVYSVSSEKPGLYTENLSQAKQNKIV